MRLVVLYDSYYILYLRQRVECQSTVLCPLDFYVNDVDHDRVFSFWYSV